PGVQAPHALPSEITNRDRLCLVHDSAPTDIYTLSLHDALPILPARGHTHIFWRRIKAQPKRCSTSTASVRRGSGTSFWLCLYPADRKSTRLNSSHVAT